MVRGGSVDRSIRRAKIFALTKGFRGRSKNCYSLAIRAAHKALQHAYRGRKLKKRDFRSLWITRISNAAQEQKMPYSMFMHNMVRLEVQLNRKILSELAIYEPRSFQALADLARRRQSKGLLNALK
ncbi:39S ribosomal protein L20, mitochondrial [Trichoplax sp. H2]|uniref:Large ribosomal subunit protein bL20m n=1 Tax=Trichoplax adhaerens TaxID=10228 RepID=B3S0A4_TRIAD|nr:hypothetical protein TRIADDRAFT_57742 [Trichoplax adhaerens]EDV23976.1 hypothetical protein TRIADDRAFT_57742 [Trichoplax adhaerens]RDD36807.1 39S ribosomal protein L20, mitochondrial [Trichoplax sp. H2]|eukprot:XP_002113502.1 hypothetical protein TRIADDRAFT_57742 [Trichoplax adhaerens]